MKVTPAETYHPQRASDGLLMNLAKTTFHYDIHLNEDKSRGYFEHHEHGEDAGGGLWFSRDEEGRLELIDCDGPGSAEGIPDEVAEALVELGFIVGEDFRR